MKRCHCSAVPFYLVQFRLILAATSIYFMLITLLRNKCLNMDRWNSVFQYCFKCLAYPRDIGLFYNVIRILQYSTKYNIFVLIPDSLVSWFSFHINNLPSYLLLNYSSVLHVVCIRFFTQIQNPLPLIRKDPHLLFLFLFFLSTPSCYEVDTPTTDDNKT